MPGVPRANYLPFPFQIVQSTDVILIAYEFAESIGYCTWISQRSVAGGCWMGHSNAEWDGDTLVVE